MQPLVCGGPRSVGSTCSAQSLPSRHVGSVCRRLRLAPDGSKHTHVKRSRGAHRSACQDASRHSSMLPQQRALSLAVGESHTLGGTPHSTNLYPAASSKKKNLRVAVDVDEVLGRFVFALNQFVLEQYGKDHEVEDFFVYEFAQIWNCSQEESRHIVHEFFKSGHFQKGIPVIPGAYESLARLGEYCDLVVVTSRQHAIQGPTLEWIDTHFPSIFSEVYFGNHWALQGTSRKKSEICRSIGADILIDDNPVYAQECAAAGIHVLLYDWESSYPWAKLPQGCDTSRISVVTDWQQAEMEICRVALGAVPQQ